MSDIRSCSEMWMVGVETLQQWCPVEVHSTKYQEAAVWSDPRINRPCLVRARIVPEEGPEGEHHGSGAVGVDLISRNV